MKRAWFSWTALLGLSAALLCAQQDPKVTTTRPNTEAAKPAREPGTYAVLSTSMGDITIKLFEKESPVTVKNFLDLAQGRKAWTDPRTGQKVQKPLYNGTTFHRVIKGFMIQGGDPLGTGTGGTEEIKDEFSPNLKFDVPGRVAMANRGPDTGSCQFFITEVPTAHLNGKHTIFGQVALGQDVVDRIVSVPTGAGDKPITPIVIRRVTVLRVVDPSVPKPAAPVTRRPTPGTGTRPAVRRPAATGTKPAAAPGAKPAAPPAKKPATP